MVNRDEIITYKNRHIDDIKKDVIGFYKKSMSQSQTLKITKAQKVTLNCIKIIEMEFDNPDLTIHLLADDLNLEESYLRRVFKKENGKTVNEYIIYFRMQKAKDLLLMHKYKHTAIASMIGYEDAGYFSKSFKKVVGISPKEFEISD